MSTSAVIGALRVNLSANAAEFLAGLDGAEKALKRAGARMTSVGQTMSAAITAPIVGMGALTLRTAGNFEAAMNRVGAALDVPADVMAQLSDAAKEMGRTTQFSASEAGDAIEILAKNGLDAAQILGGALDASLKLAAASGADLASAGDLATDVMLNFGKGAGELGGVVDGVTGVLLQSKFGFDDYRLALAQAGGVAGGLGVTLDDFNAVIAATSSAFASGSDAGTSFKTFLQRLVPASTPAADAMERLGLEFHNADGSMKSMAEVAEELQTKMSGLTDLELSEAMSDIFGTDAMRTAIGLMKAGGEGIEDLNAKISEASASEQAAARMEGFNGAMKRLSSAFEALQLAIADSGLLDMVTGFVEDLAGLVAKVSEANPKIVKFGTVFAGLAAAMGPVLIALGALATAVAVVGAPIALVIAAVTALTAAVVAFWPEIQQMAAVVQEEAVAAFEGLKSRAQDAVAFLEALPGRMVAVGSAIVDGLWRGLVERFASVREGLASFADGLVDSVKETLGIHSPSRVFQEIGRNLMEGFGLGIEEGGAEARASATSAISGVGSEITGPFKDALARGEGHANAFAETVAAAMERLRDRLLDRAFAPIEAGIDSMLDKLTSGGASGGGVLGTLLGAAVGGIAGSVGGINLGGGAGITPSGSYVNIQPTSGFNPFHYARGTTYHPGGMAVVGDGGEPEILNLPRGSRVTPLSDAMGRGGGDLGTLRVELAADLDARIESGSRRVAVQVVRTQEPKTISAAVKAAYASNQEVAFK